MHLDAKVTVRGSELGTFYYCLDVSPPKRKRLREEDNTKGKVHYFIPLVDVCW